ncbi:hypothetical protein GQ55_3G350000 [Panicum hallii var. hallii]|uniref:Uncharacterized protein n=1 Tax=Panicum hallii var. hallii TaxID=1504633 RepID=A0A2T7EFS9_9POAL|nr:hypothetical protein GQ55_3G350000 [Panicum hallii var. hallii]
MEKVFKLFFVPVWRWPKKDSVCLYRECSLLAPGSLGAEPSPSLLPREELWLWELRRPAGNSESDRQLFLRYICIAAYCASSSRLHFSRCPDLQYLISPGCGVLLHFFLLFRSALG